MRFFKDKLDRHFIAGRQRAYLKSYGNCTRIALRSGTMYVTLLAIGEIEGQWPAAAFCRVHILSTLPV